MSAPFRPVNERIAEKIEERDGGFSTPCWFWTGYINRLGYAVLSIQDRPNYVHRLSYQIHIGKIPEGLELDHLCRNRSCVNPSHLEPVTNRENVLRGLVPTIFAAFNKARKEAAEARTHCKLGHELTPENTRVEMRKGVIGNRLCKTCQREISKARTERERLRRTGEHVSKFLSHNETSIP